MICCWKFGINVTYSPFDVKYDVEYACKMNLILFCL